MQEFSTKSPAIKCIKAGYTYPDGVTALKELNLVIGAQEKVGIIGPNGSGKSTFLNLLNGSRSGSGDIFINGIKISRETDKHVKAMVGLVFQNPDDQLFCPSIFEDVAFGPANFGITGNELNARVFNALAEVGLTGYEERSSDHLSYGERKLASIATIISMQPDIIAMDEPVSNLDHLHRRKITEWIDKSERTIVLTSHDLEMLIEVCERVIILNNGIKVADGPILEILGNDSLLHKNNLEQPLSLKYGAHKLSKF